MGDDFYVFLSSNVKNSQGIKENKISNFTTQLPEKLLLNEQFDVAISDISYSKTWFNITQPQKVWVVLADNSFVRTNVTELPPGIYSSGEILSQTINRLAKVSLIADNTQKWFKTLPTLIYDSKTDKFKIDLGFAQDTNSNLQKKESPIILKFSRQLSEMLGFIDWNDESLNERNYNKFNSLKNTLGDGTRLEASYTAQLHSINSLYVYTDIIQPRIIGNIKAPLLRQVEVSNKTNFGDNCFIEYKNWLYHPLSHFEIDSIQIEVKDDTGEYIDFKSGRLTVSLHFRKRPSNINFLKIK